MGLFFGEKIVGTTITMGCGSSKESSVEVSPVHVIARSRSPSIVISREKNQGDGESKKDADNSLDLSDFRPPTPKPPTPDKVKEYREEMAKKEGRESKTSQHSE